MLLTNATVESRIYNLAMAPLEHPDIIPSVLPLILGAVVLELYFGKHKNETLGWNTSVGNAIIWISTGVNLFLTEKLETQAEVLASGFMLLFGALIGYLNFFHKWSESVAFRASGTDVIYSLGYVTVVVVKTDIPADNLTFKASAAFIFATILFFHMIRAFETPARDDFMRIK